MGGRGGTWIGPGAIANGASVPDANSASADRCGFQITFFRSRTPVAADQPSRFAAKQLLFAHAALMAAPSTPVAASAQRAARRAAGGAPRNFAADAVSFTPGRVWTSPASRARYPVEWTIATPAGRYRVKSLLDAQELDSRASTGAIYWEGLSELQDEAGRRIGHGYLEMTGYAGRLSL